MNRTVILIAVGLLGLTLGLGRASAEEIIIWYDEQGAPHSAKTPEDIPPEHRPQATGTMTSVAPTMGEEAAADGAALGSDPLLYRDGLGLFQPFQFELDLEKKTGYVFVGTKYNLIRARSALAASKGEEMPVAYAAQVNVLTRLPVAFYSWGFEPVLMLLMQEGRIIKGETGFDKETDPALQVPAYVKSFPYEALEFSKPVQIQMYSREGNMVQIVVDLPAYK